MGYSRRARYNPLKLKTFFNTKKFAIRDIFFLLFALTTPTLGVSKRQHGDATMSKPFEMPTEYFEMVPGYMSIARTTLEKGDTLPAFVLLDAWLALPKNKGKSEEELIADLTLHVKYSRREQEE